MPNPGSPIDVFLSFRGRDTRENFICFLNDALVRHGLRTFMDEVDIHSGEGIDSRIREGIRYSRSAIIVFSNDYASSTWCLDELILILERKRTSNYILLPIYYEGVKPADLKYQRGNYGTALENHKVRHMDRVEAWKDALTEVGGCKGRIVQGDLLKFVKDIAGEIRDLIRETNPPQPSVNPPIGHSPSFTVDHASILTGQSLPQASSLQPKEQNQEYESYMPFLALSGNNYGLLFELLMNEYKGSRATTPSTSQQQQPYVHPRISTSSEEEDTDATESSNMKDLEMMMAQMYMSSSLKNHFNI